MLRQGVLLDMVHADRECEMRNSGFNPGKRLTECPWRLGQFYAPPCRRGVHALCLSVSISLSRSLVSFFFVIQPLSMNASVPSETHTFIALATTA